MGDSNQSKVPSHPQLKKLRTALAIQQGINLLPKLIQELESTVSHDQTKRVSYLTALFTRIHREMFSDWKEQIDVDHRPGIMPDADKRRRFRETIERLVLDGDSNAETAIFDNNGFIVYHQDIAERLAGFYHAMRRIRPFSYGNRLTLDFFVTALGNLPAFKAVYDAGIDFRRLSLTDTQALHDPLSPIRQLSKAFAHALDPRLGKSLNNCANRYGKWPENKHFLLGIPFLSHHTADGVPCLITVNGGLVPLESINIAEFIKGQHFADNSLSASENIIGFLDGSAELRHPGITDIDGIPVREDGVAPLFCLDINMLTGLRSPSHAELIDLLQECSGEKVSLFSLADNPVLKQRLLTVADGESRLARTVEIAYARLSRINHILQNAVLSLFDGKTADPHPKMFMAMGGAGSGKTAVEELAKTQCGENFVTASLDEFRKLSQLYRLLTLANHHSDDYVYVEPFANRLRDLVSQQARLSGINLLYDGTGIPYHPRYSTIVKEFKAAGFHTSITAVDAFLVKPNGRESELSRSGVIASVKSRYESTGRALPWVVTVDKHIRSPRAFLNALEDLALDKISLFANDGERDRHYLVAESFLFDDAELNELHLQQQQGNLAAHFNASIQNREDAVLKQLSANDTSRLNAWIARNPDFSETNVGYQIYRGREINRVLLIYNLRRMVDFIEKRQLNPNASGEEGLLHKPSAMAFHVDPHAPQAWITRLQGTME